MDAAYKIWIGELKQKIRSTQLKAAVAVNEQMIMLYWEIGMQIVEKQQEQSWGSKVVDQMAKDLKNELPDTQGFSRTNLFAMRKFYLFYNGAEIVQQPGGQMQDAESQPDIIVQQPAGLLSENNILCKIPWQHHVIIIGKCTSTAQALFYIRQTILHNWSRSVLEIQMESKLEERQGKALNNFELTLPKLQSDLAKETLKDPFKFDFLTLEANVQELQLERMLTDNISRFLLELGKGFAFVGRQYPLQIGNKERKLDLLFYHLKMHCYIVIDLKMGEFEPEFAGKMNYYLSAVDKQIKTEADNPSIGIILCKSKDKIEVEYALQDLNKPMGISEFTFNELPIHIQKNMPTVEELENEFINEIQE
jgi:predicted nuclease of restriction endonuclease-like (RecB) superfamily